MSHYTNFIITNKEVQMVQYNLIYNFENVHFTYTDIFLSCIKLNDPEIGYE